MRSQLGNMDLRSTKIPMYCEIKVLLLYDVIVFNMRSKSIDFPSHFIQEHVEKEKLLSCIAWSLKYNWLNFYNGFPREALCHTYPLLGAEKRDVVPPGDPTTPDAITEGSWGFEHIKAVFKQEVIPFIKTLRELFNDCDNGLNLELNEVKKVFNQMEAAVERYVMNIVMHADFVPVNVLPANNKFLMLDNLGIERLEQENNHLFELLLSHYIVLICVNSLATCTNCREMQQSFINEYNENLVLKAELANKKEHMVEKKVFNEIVLRCSRLENRCVNLELKLQHQKELIEHARALRPLDNDLDYACKYAKRIQEVLIYVTATCPSLTKPGEKLVADHTIEQKQES
ncbi:hypothetical protein Tco_0405184 [Tanacetum coccineum]